MTKKLKSNRRILVMLLLVCSLSTTACGTDKTVKKEANKISDAIESKDLSLLDKIINGVDDLSEDEELSDFFETDTEQENGIMSQSIEQDTVEVKKIGDKTITYKITAPELSDLFNDMRKNNVTEENVDSFIKDYIVKADKVTNEVEVPYTYENGNYSAEYGSEEFINALTGNMVTAYQNLMQDVVNEMDTEE